MRTSVRFSTVVAAGCLAASILGLSHPLGIRCPDSSGLTSRVRSEALSPPPIMVSHDAMLTLKKGGYAELGNGERLNRQQVADALREGRVHAACIVYADQVITGSPRWSSPVAGLFTLYGLKTGSWTLKAPQLLDTPESYAEFVRWIDEQFASWLSHPGPNLVAADLVSHPQVSPLHPTLNGYVREMPQFSLPSNRSHGPVSIDPGRIVLLRGA